MSAFAADFTAAMRAAGLEFDGHVIADGRLHRFKVNGDHSPNGYYTLHPDGIPAGSFGCWKRDIKGTWCAKSADTLTDAERAERDRRWKQQQQERDADRKRQQREAGCKAAAILDAAQPATDEHPYLQRKAVKAHPGVMVGRWLNRPDCLLIPLRGIDGSLMTVQAVSAGAPFNHGGNKDFLKGGAKKGAHFVIGDLRTTEAVLIAEGYATAATLHEATGYAAVMACDAGNLAAVAAALRSLHPDKRIVLCADSDKVGTAKAQQAAHTARADVIWPRFAANEEGTDFNDLVALHGLEAVKALLHPPKPNLEFDIVPDDPAEPVAADDAPKAEKAKLVFNNSLLKHNKTAQILYEAEFKRRLFYDPITLEWLEYSPERGVFERRPQLAVEKAVYRAIGKWENTGGKGFDAAYVSGVTKCLLYESVRQAEPVKGKICFTNGVLDLATRELLPHSPEHHFTTSLPFAWTPDAPEPMPVINWLHEVMEGHTDQVQLTRAYLNAVVVGRPDLQRFLELVGYGGSGKGTLIRLITALIGSDAVHATQLKQLEENRFESANIFGKKLVVISDAEKYHGDVSMLKAITGQDAIRFEQKHKQGGDNFTYGGMVLISANQYTESTDYSSGIQRRRISIPFNVVCPANKRRDLEAEFEPLLPAVMKWVLDMPQHEVTAYLRSTSTHAASLRSARLEALAATNPMVAWMLDNVRFAENVESQIGLKNHLTINEGRDIDGTTTTHTAYENEDIWLYPNYCRWCDQNGKKPVAKNQFSTVLVDAARNMLAKSYVRYERRSTGRYVVGVTLHGTHDGACQPMTTYDNLMTTQVIDSAELDNLDNILEVTEFLNTESVAAHSAEIEISDIGELEETCGEGRQGCHVQHNQQVKSSQVVIGRHSVVTGSSSSGLGAIADGDGDRLWETVLRRTKGAQSVRQLAVAMKWRQGQTLAAVQSLQVRGRVTISGEAVRPVHKEVRS